ncbi:MAG: biotin/lipoyl-containing protein [Candidatus Cyclobacteriaceae bacterium M3_2C_046]
MKNYKFTINGNEYAVEIKSMEDNIAEVEVNGTPFQVELSKEVKTTKTPKLIRSSVSPKTEKKPITASTGLTKTEAPLPGTIFQIKAKEGDVVKKGDVLMIMEAMKMENNILAEVDGTVKSIKVKEGDAVLQGDVLAELE